MTRRRVRARKSRSSDSSLRGGLPLARVRLRRIGLSWTEPLCVSAIRLRSLAQELRSSSPGALGKGARRHEVCRRRYHCPVPGCPLNRSRRCTRSRVPPSASLCSRSCGCHFPLRRGALGARLIGACGPRHLKVASHEEMGRMAGRVVDLSFSHLWRAARAKPGSRMPTPCGRMSHAVDSSRTRLGVRVRPGFAVTGYRLRERLAAPVAEIRDVQTPSSGAHR